MCTELDLIGMPQMSTAYDLAVGDNACHAVCFNSPKEPPPPPAPEPSWEEVESDVIHLNEENFKPTLKKKKHALIMFYAPCELT